MSIIIHKEGGRAVLRCLQGAAPSSNLAIESARLAASLVDVDVAVECAYSSLVLSSHSSFGPRRCLVPVLRPRLLQLVPVGRGPLPLAAPSFGALRRSTVTDVGRPPPPNAATPLVPFPNTLFVYATTRSNRSFIRRLSSFWSRSSFIASVCIILYTMEQGIHLFYAEVAFASVA